ncbi:unnamed protein product [Blepharisma stoltei]|uniref:Uncharacterized protein n=1 Tax=Blepharisma stoltei TaxID=1481888 RepID=A0AAU9ILP1_9CILI|nr:unnamed protein product [Blepharisma stoltei]
MNKTDKTSISPDAPTFFHIPHTKYHSISPPPGIGPKVLCPALTYGMSPENPLQTSKSTLLKSDLRRSEILKHSPNLAKNADTANFLNNRKIDHLKEKAKFEYQDFTFKDTKWTYDLFSLRPTDLLDLLADKRPNIKYQAPYYKKYHEALNKSEFHKASGAFTFQVEHKQPITRTGSDSMKNLNVQLEGLKRKLNESHISQVGSFIARSSSQKSIQSPSTINTSRISSKEISRELEGAYKLFEPKSVKHRSHSNSPISKIIETPENDLYEDIEEFEKKLKFLNSIPRPEKQIQKDKY